MPLGGKRGLLRSSDHAFVLIAHPAFFDPAAPRHFAAETFGSA
jgi:hypothetical protein